MTTEPIEPKDLPGLEESAEFAQNMATLMQRAQEISAQMIEASAREEPPLTPDPLNIAPAFQELAAHMAAHPERVMEATVEFWSQQAELWRRTMMGAMGLEKPEPLIEPAPGDKRFKDEEWSQNRLFDYLKQAYLITAKWTQDFVNEVEDVPERDRKKLNFFTRNMIEAFSPSNFAATNPEVIRATIEQKGANLVRGVEALARDVARGKGKLLISQTDMDAFEVGRNLAVTEGKVIHQSDLLQLIQYAPRTEKVYARPLLFIPPWINKYYVLDLNEKKSMMKWLVEQGYTVFMISWVNPSEAQKDETWDTYMNAILEAMDAALEETGQESLNLGSYCIGATMCGTLLAYLARIGDRRAHSATLFTGQFDFTDAGELQALVDDKTLELVDEQMDRGYLPAESMANAFNMLRSSDLIWSYVVQNYMLGKDPFPFDLLYWNADSTCMPAKVHHFYLEKFYNENALAKGELVVQGERIDLSEVSVPLYHLATREDHIAPAESVYRGAKLFTGAKNRFVLGGSGHIAGVVNPPAAGKYQYWTRPGIRQATLDAWLEGASETPGSWWVDWDAWLKKLSGRKVDAREPGAVNGVIEDAPGSYVKVRFDRS